MNNKEIFKEKEADFKGRIKNLKAKTEIYHERVFFFSFFKNFKILKNKDYQN